MNAYDQALGHALKLKFGTAPNEPNGVQLERIKLDIKSLVIKGISPTKDDWNEIVKKHCPSFGSFFYKGTDTADLITLLKLATKD